MAARPPADRDVAPALAQAEYWARANGCIASTHQASKRYELTEFTGCRDGAEVKFYIVSGNGHAWPAGKAGRPGADAPVAHFRADDVTWDFFRRHARLPSPRP